jgi:peptidoglycan/LPS O-acetylase OafA/YrhL
MNFRTDIEGLRALAILLVIAVHAGIPGFRGGFIGVDVFFVISGYLITDLLAAEIEETGRLDFARFYARRMRRLLPALSLMLFCTLGASMWLLSPIENSRLARSALATAAYTSNVWFLASSVDYFSPNVSTNPLLHTWSLAVEEQFYLLWPVALFCWIRKRRRRRDLLAPFVWVFLISLAASIGLTHSHQPVAFFSSPTRAWEFAAGGLATLVSNKEARYFRYGILGWTGIAIILGCGIWITPNQPFPGIVALIPVVGTVFALISGRLLSQQTGPAWFLSLPLFRKIGFLSYSWYLWHWPVLVFGRILIPRAGVTVGIGLSLLSLGVAYLANVFVENPIRFNQNLARTSARSIFVGGSLTIAGMLAAVGCGKLANHWANSPAEFPIARAIDNDRKDNCVTGFHEVKLKNCSFGESTNATVVIFGDSHAGQWLPALMRVANQENLRIITLLKASCPSVTVSVYNPRLKSEEAECGVWRRKALDYIADLHPSLVILSNSAAYVQRAGLEDEYAQLSPKEWESGVRTTLATLQNAKVRVALLRDTPRPDVDIPVCLSRSTSHPTIFPSSACYTAEDHALAPAVWNGEISAARDFGNAFAVDLTANFCFSGACPPEVNGEVVYRDTNHISANFARLLAPALANQLRPVIDSRNP